MIISKQISVWLEEQGRVQKSLHDPKVAEIKGVVFLNSSFSNCLHVDVQKISLVLLSSSSCCSLKCGYDGLNDFSPFSCSVS